MAELVYKDDAKRRSQIVKALIERDGDACFFCSKVNPGQHYTIDHYIPLMLDGSNTLSNLRLACLPCNQEKNNYTVEEWARRVAVKVARGKLLLDKQRKLLRRLDALARKDAKNGAV